MTAKQTPPVVEATTQDTSVSTSTPVPSPAPVVEYKPPSQAMLSIMLIRDVLDDLLPGGYQPWLIAALMIIVVLIIFLAAGHG